MAFDAACRFNAVTDILKPLQLFCLAEPSIAAGLFSFGGQQSAPSKTPEGSPMSITSTASPPAASASAVAAPNSTAAGSNPAVAGLGSAVANSPAPGFSQGLFSFGGSQSTAQPAFGMPQSSAATTSTQGTGRLQTQVLDRKGR